jgi:molybdopterin-biosynthesis enzyme MoeA-like protein
MFGKRKPLDTDQYDALATPASRCSPVRRPSSSAACRLGEEVEAEKGRSWSIKTVVGDERGDLATLLRQALERTDLVVLTGGLGPTDDDLTRDVVSDVLGLPMAIDESIVDKIRARFENRGLVMPEVNRRVMATLVERRFDEDA